MSHTEGRPSRRGLLARGTAALLTGAAIATTAHAAPVASPGGAGDDAEILRFARDFWVHDAVVRDWNADRVSWEIGAAANDQWWECLEAMAAIRATTPAGAGAKANCILHALETRCESTGTADDCARAFLADLAGRTAA